MICALEAATDSSRRLRPVDATCRNCHQDLASPPALPVRIMFADLSVRYGRITFAFGIPQLALSLPTRLEVQNRYVSADCANCGAWIADGARVAPRS